MEDAPSVRIDAERNRRVLLDAAAGALARDPDASLVEVARLAGLTRATLYRHFGSRERLLDALRDDALQAATEAVAAARPDEGAALEALRRVIAAMVSEGGRFWPLLMERGDRNPKFLHRRSQVFAPVVAIIERGQATGSIRADVSPAWAVTALAALLTAAVRQGQGFEGAGITERVFGTLAFGVQNPSNNKN